ncbi:MAG: hypothetical protein A4E44_00898 [Methanosaeta sp. PtaB.Bin018]|jgi:DNA-binding MarR family transcriptional regulator|nr:hypothetical protein [Methanothrix sp.]OPX76125.1 MAG: hypothetical protein A4E44_00898 [Methanosaeta sp. PtaB.Bin018]OPY43364.1 MAG: hypothetical protein A4E46_01863 [Methanosaeta sp. PtaU1.Bin016]
MSRKMGEIPANSSSALQERALNLIGSTSDGLLQSELRRLLCIDSSKCSRMVWRMLSSGHIYRERVPSSSTFRIRLSHQTGKAARFSYIDRYLTEIYLEYVTRS